MRAMKKSEAIQKAGGAKALAALLGITFQAVYKWSDDTIPPLAAYRLRDLKPEWFKVKKAAKA